MWPRNLSPVTLMATFHVWGLFPVKAFGMDPIHYYISELLFQSICFSFCLICQYVFGCYDKNSSDTTNFQLKRQHLLVVGMVPDEHPIEEDDFIDSDYDIPSGDEDFQQVLYERNGENKGSRDIPSFPQNSTVIEGLFGEESESSSDNSEDLFIELDTDDDGDTRFAEFNEEKEMYNPRLRVGLVFRDFDQLKRACRNWGIKNRFQLWFSQNDRKRVICACHNKQCSFRIYAAHMSKDNPSVQIKSANLDHSCGKVFNNFHVNSRWLATKYFDKFKADPNWSCNGIIKQVKDDHGFTISHMKAWRTKHLAMKLVNGDEGEQYTNLTKYAAELMQTNPGSTLILWRDEGVFKGFYICLKPLKDAFWSGCRPFIGFDGCFLKSLYGGQLLSAVGIDPNDCILPIAYAVVLVENRDT
ncbi:uncharacterized protein LOC120280475 [Dioscorea cayenensis subsp. rotundata]|uniref:Uncharacterized protein LOC120280475 n=1 Tax=Dioscorea cayennensis subsp. rotundata TaxID=55577 RepID=A0AB40CWS0_DIOCR|nr:uncharacterized protein LOC120280475 [Dioscorea cayenensis subsp. rotundata]